jgi:hypothetical protein
MPVLYIPLGNGGWLALTMPGLSPDQMRHALRGALTLCSPENWERSEQFFRVQQLVI